MKVIMSWVEYAEWLISISGMRPNAAIEKVAKYYQKQYGRPLSEDDKRNFLSYYGTPMWDKVARAP